jgi:integrase
LAEETTTNDGCIKTREEDDLAQKGDTMSVYKIGDVYHFRFMYKGVVIRKSTKQSNRREAERMEGADKTNRARGELGLGEKPVAPSLERFLTERVRPFSLTETATTARWYRDGMNGLLSYKPLRTSRLDEITSESIRNYCAHRIERGFAVGSVNRELRVLRRSLRLAQEWGMISTVPKVKMAGKEVRRERVVKEEEFAKYLSFAAPLLADVTMILYETGLRPDECHRLEWRDIDLEHNCLFVRSGKTKAARRRLPLTPSVRSVFETRWQLADRPDRGYVFPAPTKTGHIDHSTTKKQHNAALAASKVEPFVIYSLRHSFATRISSHVDAFTLCKVMGWETIAIAMTYIHPDDNKVLAVFSGHEFGHVAEKRLTDGAERITRSN